MVAVVILTAELLGRHRRRRSDPCSYWPWRRRAHQRLDRAVDRLYRRTRFANERERVEHLFALYERLRRPLAGS